MTDIFSKEFWRAAISRAVRTICQTAIAELPAAATISAVDWKTVLSTSLLAGLVSILTSITMGIPEVTKETPKDTKET